MKLFRTATPLMAAAGLLLALGLMPAAAADDKKDKDKPKPKLKKFENTWIDPEDRTLPVDYQIQGEYSGDKHGCQVIALDKGRFQAVVYPGGLPFDGWD